MAFAQDLTENVFTLSGHTFEGWAATGDGAVQYSDRQNVSNLSEDNDAIVQLYAKWTELTLSSSVSGGNIYTGGRITLTPSVDGGEWDWDSEYFTATFNSPATFTGLKTGTSTITYAVDGASTTYDVTIEQSELPATGQDFAWVWVLGVLAVCAGAAAVLSGLRKRATRT